MAEYIERDKAIKAVSEWYRKALHPENMSSYNKGERAAYRTALSEIANLPATDVRPVVLCRDCDMYECHEYDGGCKYACQLFKRQMQETDFCSYGVKREES